MIRTSKADELKICFCIPIHIGLILMAIYHFILTIIYIIGLSKALSTFEGSGMNGLIKLICVVFLISAGLRCVYPLSICLLRIPYQRQSAKEFIDNSCHQRWIFIGRLLLLVAPMMVALVFLLGLQMSTTYETITAVMIFIGVWMDMMFSMYIFTVINRFASTKWPKLWQ